MREDVAPRCLVVLWAFAFASACVGVCARTLAWARGAVFRTVVVDFVTLLARVVATPWRTRVVR